MTAVAETIRVLHVDENSEFADTTATVLERIDDRIAVETVTSPTAGRERLATESFDCIISDYEMAETDGIEFLESVRETHPDLPFILFTDRGSEAIASDAISAGVTDYLRKQSGKEQYELLATRIDTAVGQYHAERELERTRDLLTKTERIADVGGWEIDTESREVFWTDPLFDLLGVDGNEEPPLGAALDLYHEDDRHIVEDAVEAALEDGEQFDVEVRFRRPDGETRWARVQGTPALKDGTVRTLRGAVQDITERRRREQILQEIHGIISDRDQSFEQQVQKLLEVGRRELDTQYGTLSRIDGEEYIFQIVATDDESIQAGDVVPVSATNCEIAASTEETLVLGDVERDAPSETDRAGFTEWGIACYLGSPVFVDDEVYGTFCFYGTETRDGQFSEWEVTIVDLMSRWVSYELERQQVTEELQEKNDQLEQFVSIVSHDLRNPLNVIGLESNLAKEECNSDHLDAVTEAHERMEALIEDLLTLAREGDTVEQLEPVEITMIANDCWKTVETSGATIITDSDRIVQADKSRLKHVFENLFRNSVEHGGEDVTITVGDLDDGFYLEDTGPGIPPADRKSVFEPGYTTAEEGTGFGMSIVGEIIEAHGWEIRVTESESGGARFEITGVEIER